MDRTYKGHTIGRCDTITYLTDNYYSMWIVYGPTANGVRFHTLREAKEWINSKINLGIKN